MTDEELIATLRRLVWSGTIPRTAADRIEALKVEVAAAYETAAKVCDRVAVDGLTQCGREHAEWMKATAEDCALGIRALIGAKGDRT